MVLHVHFYRMLASFDEAEDAVEETFMRARDTFDGSAPVRARLYEIATSMRLDAIRRMRPLGHGHCPKP